MIAEDTAPLPADVLALLIESVQDYAIFLLSPTGRIRSWNRGAERIVGYEAGEAIGRHFSFFYLPEDLAAHKTERELETATAEGRVEDESWRVRKDGTRFWANSVITALRNPDGSLQGFAKVTRDLTRRREAEEKLRQSEEMFRLLVECVRDYAIFLLDPEGNVATWNAGARRIKGYEPEEIIGRHFSTFYPESEKRARKPERELEIARERGSVEDVGWRVRKDGTMFWANVVITAVRDEHGTLRGFAKVTRDITERMKAEEMQRALLEQREARITAEEERRRTEASYRESLEANRVKDEFLMTLSHELRTPMTAILGWARLLPGMAQDDPMFTEAVAAIGRGAQLQARLIDDVLDVSRIVSGKLRLTIESVDVARLVADSVEAVRAGADAKDITVSTVLSSVLGAMIGDATRLQQVLWNLLTNAVKYTPKQGTVRVEGRRTASQIQISVIDSGEGIDAQFLPHIFEPFRQAERPSTRVHGGLGLGLSIVRYLVEAHGGTVVAESGGRGKGAKFTVTLPIRALSSAAATLQTAAGEARPIIPHRRLDGVSILLVEDEREGREMLRVTLERAGAKVTAVDSAGTALGVLAEIQPTLILTDIAMPGMDGYALTREIRRRSELADVKIVALTAFPAMRTKPEEVGLAAYLMKPIDPIDLVDRIAEVLASPAA